MYKLLFSLFFAFTCISCKNKENPDLPTLENQSIWVVNGGDNSISILDPTNHLETKRVFLQAPPNTYLHHISANSDFSKFGLAFPEYDFSMGHDGLHTINAKGFASIFDRNNQKITSTIKVPFANHNAIFSPDDQEIWTSLVSHNGRVNVYNAQNGTLIKEIIVGPDPHEIMFSEDGKYVITSCMESSFVTIIDAKTKQVFKEIKVDIFPTNVWPGLNSDQIIVENSNAKSINFISLEKMEVVDFIDFTFKPGFSKFDSNGNLWICSKGTDYLYIFSKESGVWKEKHVISTAKDPHALLFHNNQCWLVNQKQNSVEIFDINTFQKNNEISVGLKPNGIIFVP